MNVLTSVFSLHDVSNPSANTEEPAPPNHFAKTVIQKEKKHRSEHQPFVMSPMMPAPLTASSWRRPSTPAWCLSPSKRGEEVLTSTWNLLFFFYLIACVMMNPVSLVHCSLR